MSSALGDDLSLFAAARDEKGSQMDGWRTEGSRTYKFILGG